MGRSVRANTPSSRLIWVIAGQVIEIMIFGIEFPKLEVEVTKCLFDTWAVSLKS